MPDKSEMMKLVLGQESAKGEEEGWGGSVDCEVRVRMKKKNRTRNPFQKCLSCSEVM